MTLVIDAGAPAPTPRPHRIQRNYAGADPTQDLVAAFRDCIPRLEYLADLCPAVEPALVAEAQKDACGQPEITDHDGFSRP
ncbi:MAG: hypothetical protein ACRDQ9_16060 [Pseudonocardiaceae bacterium]